MPGHLGIHTVLAVAKIFEVKAVRLSCDCALCGHALSEDAQRCVCGRCLFAYCCEHVDPSLHDCDEARVAITEV